MTVLLYDSVFLPTIIVRTFVLILLLESFSTVSCLVLAWFVPLLHLFQSYTIIILVYYSVSIKILSIFIYFQTILLLAFYVLTVLLLVLLYQTHLSEKCFKTFYHLFSYFLHHKLFTS